MNILITIYYPLGYGGAEVSTQLICEELKRRGHNIIFASRGKFKDFKCYEIPSFKKNPIYSFYVRKLTKLLREIIRKENIDVVYAQDFNTTKAAMISAKIEHVPISVHLRDYWFACPKSSCLKPNFEICELCSYSRLFFCSKLWRFPWDIQRLYAIKSCWKLFKDAAILFTGDSSTNRRLEKIGIPYSKYLSLNNFRDTKRFEKIKKTNKNAKKIFGFEGKTVLAFVGNFAYTKGFYTLITIIPQILVQHKDVAFLVVGKGEGQHYLLPLLKRFPNRLKHLWEMNYQSIEQVYAATDILLLPTLWEEPYGGVQIEAAAAGISIIAGNVGGIRNGKFGVHISDDLDTTAWIREINRLLSNKRLRKQIALKGKTFATTNLDIIPYVDKIEKSLLATQSFS